MPVSKLFKVSGSSFSFNAWAPKAPRMILKKPKNATMLKLFFMIVNVWKHKSKNTHLHHNNIF